MLKIVSGKHKVENYLWVGQSVFTFEQLIINIYFSFHTSMTEVKVALIASISMYCWRRAVHMVEISHATKTPRHSMHHITFPILVMTNWMSFQRMFMWNDFYYGIVMSEGHGTFLRVLLVSISNKIVIVNLR